MGDHLSFVEGLVARATGPMKFRMLLQPATALYFAIRDGRLDAQEGRSLYFWGLFTDPANRREMLRNGWKSIGKVFVIAVVLDFVFQYVAFHDFRPLGGLLAGLVLAILPYLFFRGLVNRLFRHPKGDPP